MKYAILAALVATLVYAAPQPEYAKKHHHHTKTTSSSAAAPTSTVCDTKAAGNLQSFSQVLGGPAPGVYASGTGYETCGVIVGTGGPFDALSKSCSIQQTSCNEVATTTACTNQYNDCITLAYQIGG